MACITSSRVYRSGSLVSKPSFVRRHVSCKAADQSIVAASIQQHFGSKALEQFEKTELGKLDINDLNELSQQLKERVSNLKALDMPEIPADLKLPELPELPSDLQLPDLSGVGDAVRKFGEGIDTPVELTAAFEALKSSSAASLAAAAPQNGGDFAPHWGSQAISGAFNASTDTIHSSVHGLLHQIVVQITEKLSSAGAL